MSSKTEIIKELALSGLFVEIESKYDKKNSIKAEEYVFKKLTLLSENEENGAEITGQYATPFMLFAIKSFTSTNIAALGTAFNKSGVESDDADFESDSDCGKVTLDDNEDKMICSIQEKNVDTETVNCEPEIENSTTKTKKFKVQTSEKKTSDKSKVTKEKKIDKSDAKKKDKNAKLATTKKVKDPNAPKGAKGSYMFFMEHFRSNLSEEDASKSVCEISKLGGEAWCELSEEEKQPFVDKATEDKLRYANALEIYKAENPNLDTDEKVSRKVNISKSSVSSKDKKVKRDNSIAVEKPTKKPFAIAPKAVKAVVSDEDASQAGEDADDVTVSDHEDDDADSTASSQDSRKKKEKKRPRSNNKKVASKRHKIEKTPKKVAKSSTSTPKGFKQCDLGEDLDLLNTEFMPYQTTPFPEDLKLRQEQQVMLVLPTYREFLSQLPTNCADAATIEAFQQICSLSKTIVQGIVKSLRTIPSVDQAETMDVEQVDNNATYTVISLSVNGKLFEVLHADFSSTLHTTDIFLLDAKKYKESLKQPWIQVNAQVRRAFQGEDAAQVEWHEGTVYHIRPDYATNPTKAVKVAWMQQEAGTGHWLYAYTQTDCDCSPWELELSAFVLLEKLKPAEIPKALLVGKLDAATVISYLKSCDAAQIFKDDIYTEEFYTHLPEEDRLDFHVLTRLCRAGRYADEVGILQLFSDLEKMIQLGKEFNDSNRAFLPWRQCEMMEKVVVDLKCALASAHSMPSLQEVVAENLQDAVHLLQSQDICEEV